MVVANDVEGKSWGLPIVVTSSTPEGGIGFPGRLITINGNPVFCSYSYFLNYNPAEGRIDYASYY